jgi:hypothetical protein
MGVRDLRGDDLKYARIFALVKRYKLFTSIDLIEHRKKSDGYYGNWNLEMSLTTFNISSLSYD